jgi:multidrug efflux system membrane fusion protein
MKIGRLLLAVALIGAVGAIWYTNRPAAQPDRPTPGTAKDPIPVLAATAATADVPIYLDALGTVQAFNTVNVHVMVDGPMVEVRFREGQDVKAGDVLARIDSRGYQATYDQAVAKKAQDEALLANARVDLARYQKLVATNYTSGQTSDTQRALVAEDEAQVRQDQAAIDQARTNLSYTTITAPLDGRTGIRQVDQGNIVHATDTTPLTVITQLKPISVVFTLAQQSLPAVAAAIARSTAAGGEPDVVALSQDGSGAVIDHGEVAVLDNTVDQSTGTIKLKATFPNDKLTLWPGGFVNVRMLVQTERGVTTVPPVAVQRGPQGSYVYLLNGDAVTRRSVRVGHEDERVSVITAGLEPGDQVVVDGASRLTDGAKVKVVSATPPLAGTAPERRRADATP